MAPEASRPGATAVPGLEAPGRARLALHAEASAESVAMLRVGVFLLCAAEAWVLLQQAAPIPAGAWTPFGFLAWLPASIDAALRTLIGQQVLFAVAGLSALAAAAGVLPRWSLPLATVTFIVAQAVPRALQGLVNHAQVPVMLAAFVLTLGPAADALTLWPRRRTPPPPERDYQATLVLIVAAICIGYTFISAHRIAYGGWSLFESESLRQWLVQRNLSTPDPSLSWGVRLARDPLGSRLVQVGFPLLTLLELAAPLCLFSRRFRWVFVPAMLLSHLAIFWLMRISFSQLAALYIVFIDSAWWSPRRPLADAEGRAQPLIVYFDGVCGLCNRFVDLLVHRDHAFALRFAPLQGSTAAAHGALPTAIDSVIVTEGEGSRARTFVRSDAALAALGRLGGLWSFTAVLLLVPRPLRDAVYAFVARHRYAWFGRRDVCRLPDAGEARWFLP